MARAGNNTLVYNPEVRVYIKGIKGNLDVSRDVVSGSINRITNGVSTAQVTLNNKNAKYTGQLRRMDPIVIFLKRTTWIQVFSGYLDVVPAMDLYPTTCTIRASCTLKRLKYTYWDPGLPTSQQLLMDQAQFADNKSPDNGLGKLLKQLLVNAGNWDKSQINIQQIPQSFLTYTKKYMPKTDAAATEAFLRSFMNIGGTTSGQDATASDSSSGDMHTVSANDPPDAPGLNAFLYGLRVHESGNNYTAKSSISTASGAYQYLDSTWKNFGGYKRACDAPPAVQDQRAWNDQLAAYKQVKNWGHCACMHLVGHDVDESKWDQHPGSGNPSIRDYVKDVLAKAATFKGTAPTASTPAGGNTSSTPSGTSNTKADKKGVPGSDAFDNVTKTATATSPSTTSTDATKKAGDAGTANPSATSPATATPPTKEKMQQPTAGSIGTKFGKVTDPTTKKDVDNQWVDIDCNADAQVKASLTGIVVTAGASSDTNFGKQMVEIKSSNTTSVKYGGLKTLAVKVGDQVKQGQNIGTTGGPGFEKKLRWCFIKDGTAVDPSKEVGKEETIDLAALQAQIAAGTPGSTSGLDATQQAIQDAVFNVMFAPLNPDAGGLSTGLTGERALINDEQLLSTASAMVKAGLREFMSAPNGDFVAFYPDYFGIENKTPKLKLSDVEMKDVKIVANDDAFTTHVYAIGNTNSQYTTGQITTNDYFDTSGIVTVNMPFVFNQLIHVVESERKNYTPEAIFKRFGARPFKYEYPQVRSPQFQFFLALQLFQRKWSEQSSTDVVLTFMPELYPGMRVELEGHDIGVYTNSVRHDFSFTDGFKTVAEFSCPTSLSKGVGGILPAGV